MLNCFAVMQCIVARLYHMTSYPIMLAVHE